MHHLDDPLKHAAKNIPLAKTLVPGTRERRMIRNGIFDAELAEPSDKRGSPELHDRSVVPSGSQRRTPRPASGSSAPDRSRADPGTSNEVEVRCEARKDREQRRSSAPDDLREPHRQDETRTTFDLGHSSDGPSSIDLAEIRVSTTESRFADHLNRLLQQKNTGNIAYLAPWTEYRVPNVATRYEVYVGLPE